MKKCYITTPIYYVNDRPHLGTAYTTIAADVLVRYHRLEKDESVFFLTGTDEHGLKIQQKAQSIGKKPEEFSDDIVKKFKSTWKALNIKYDNFIRTTDVNHEKAVKEVLQKLYDEKYIYEGQYEGLYCVGCEQFKSRADLTDGKCSEHNCEPELREEKAWLFKMSKFQNDLLSKIKKDQFEIKPISRKNEIISFLEKEKLQDLAISRPKEQVYWGIEIPFDKSQTTYVWVDAFLNYLTGLGWPKNNKNYQIFWPPDIQLMGKDILRVHATIWPALLIALKEKLPKKIFVNGFLTVNGQKMSKSLGNAIDPVEVAKKYGADVLRYFLLREIPFGQDGDFSIKKLEGRYNDDLANGIGNLVQRVIVMVDKYFDRKIPKIDKDPEKHPLRIDNKYYTWKDVYKDYDDAFTKLEFHKALFAINKFVNAADKYVEETKPWKLAKDESKNELSWVLFGLLDNIHQLAWQIYPFMPMTSIKIAKALKIEGLLKQNPCIKDSWVNVKPGAKIELEKPLFPKIQ